MRLQLEEESFSKAAASAQLRFQPRQPDHPVASPKPYSVNMSFCKTHKPFMSINSNATCETLKDRTYLEGRLRRSQHCNGALLQGCCRPHP